MKCNTITECQGDKHLVFNIDLRINPAERVAEVARTVVPLKEKIGLRHVSFNLAYSEGEATKYCNLPVYVTEDATERVVRLLFPADFYLTVWNGTAEVVVSGLEYHVDKRTEVVTEAMSLSTAIQPAAGRIQLSFNLSDVSAEGNPGTDAVIGMLESQARKITNWNLPVDVVIMSSSSRRFFLDILDLEKIISASSIHIKIKARRPEYLYAEIDYEVIVIDILYADGTVTVDVSNFPLENPNLIFLYENGNCIIDGVDYAHGDKTTLGRSWIRFTQELKGGHHPVVYLCSPSSERYYPANYNFNVSGGAITGGSMEISYYKEVGGQMELWIERRTFQGEPSAGNTYTPGASGMGPVILKVQLGTISY